MNDYERGYAQAIKDLNKPMDVITEKWNPSECPRCGRDFSEYEPCDDGYYDRVYGLEHCPYCSQRLCWDKVNC